MEAPKLGILGITYIAGLLLMIGFVIWQQEINLENMAKIGNLTANNTAMNATIKKMTTVQSFVDDYNEYSSICNRMQNDKADILKKQCTQQGLEFSSYYVSYPANDFLIVCMKDGKAQVMRFR
jgi:hypothetical protein